MSLSDSEYNSAPRDYNATARDYNATYKILVLGESGVGKTSLIRRFVENKFKESYLSTIGKFWKDTYYWKYLFVECQIKPLWVFLLHDLLGKYIKVYCMMISPYFQN